MGDEKITYFDSIQEQLKSLKDADPATKEATAKSIYWISKANIEDDEAQARLDLDERRVAAAEESNRLKQIELDKQDKKDIREAAIKQQEIAVKEKDSKRQLGGKIFIGVVQVTGVVLNLAAAFGYLNKFAAIEEGGVLLSGIGKKMIPNFFLNNKK